MGKKRDSLAGGAEGPGVSKEERRAEQKRRDELNNAEGTGDAPREEKKKKKKRESREGLPPILDGLENGPAVPSPMQESHGGSDKKKKVRKEQALEGGAEDRGLQSGGTGKGGEEGVEKATNREPEMEGRSEKKRKKKKERDGQIGKDGQGAKKRRESLGESPKASESGDGAGASADAPAADVSKREPEAAAPGVESGGVAGAEKKSGQRRGEKEKVKKERVAKVSKKGGEGRTEKGTEAAPFDAWGKYFEGRWQGFWRPPLKAGMDLAGGHPNGVKGTKREKAEGAKLGPVEGGDGQQAGQRKEKKSKRQKKDVGDIERPSTFPIRGPLPCHVEGCPLPARFGLKDKSKKFVPNSCKKHKAPDMTERKDLVCEVAGCTKAARYKYADQKGKCRCTPHKEEGMVR